MARAMVVQIAGCAEVKGTWEFPSIKSAVKELTEVWGMTRYPAKLKGQRFYGGWIHGENGPELTYCAVHTMREWEILKDHYYHR